MEDEQAAAVVQVVMGLAAAATMAGRMVQVVAEEPWVKVVHMGVVASSAPWQSVVLLAEVTVEQAGRKEVREKMVAQAVVGEVMEDSWGAAGSG